jgi:hypothetical protein
MDDLKFLTEIKTYIEQMEKEVDGEWGAYRSVEQLIEDKAMPELYYEVLNRLKN